jgi:predicted transcriptional regulator
MANLKAKMVIHFIMTRRYCEALSGIEKQNTKRILQNWFVQGEKFEKQLKAHLKESGLSYDDFEEEIYVLMDIMDKLSEMETETLVKLSDELSLKIIK